MTAPQLALVFAAGSQPVDTSEDAADSLAPDLLAERRFRVLRYVAQASRTPDEVVAHFDPTNANGWAPRVTELTELGYLERTAERRRTRRGRLAGVYRLTDAGRRFLDRLS